MPGSSAGPLLHVPVVVGDELNIFGAGQRVALLDEFRERVADPRNHHAPGLDAAMTVDAIFERAQLEQVFDIEGQRLGHFAFHLYRPWARGQAGGVSCRSAFVDAEFVKVVVVGDVVVGSKLLAGRGERAGDGLELGARPCCDARRDEPAEPVCAQNGGASRSRSLQETAAAQIAKIVIARGDLGGRYVGRFADQHFDLSKGKLAAAFIRHCAGSESYRK